MLDEVIDYLKQLQAQVQMMSRINMPAMMLPVAMQQQLQLSMMGQMGMMGLGLDFNSMTRPNLAAPMPHQLLHPNPFMPWDGGDARFHPQMPALHHDALPAFFACQSQVCAYTCFSCNIQLRFFVLQFTYIVFLDQRKENMDIVILI